MNIKKILVLLLFLFALISILSPLNAKSDSSLELESPKTVNNQTKLGLYVYSYIGITSKSMTSSDEIFSKRKAELNKVNKVVVIIKGEKPLTFKKPRKGWKLELNNYHFYKTFLVKGKVDEIRNKDYSIKLYDKKNKIINNKKGKVLFSDWLQGNGINSNPKKYFDQMKTRNKKNKNFLLWHWLPKLTNSSENDSFLNISSSADYYYNKNSKFKQLIRTMYTYSSDFSYITKKMEKSKTYTNGKYTLIIDTYKSGKTVYKRFTLDKQVFETSFSLVDNPYFTVSGWCNWTNPTIMNLAENIKASVIRNSNKDIYNMEIANAVIRYVQTHIKYDYNLSFDQSAISVLKRGSGTCYGNTMLAGSLLRALGIPTYFEVSQNKTISHIWPVSYVFYENTYQWVPAEPTSDYTDNQYYSWYITQQSYITPFNKNALDWWKVSRGGNINLIKTYTESFTMKKV